MSPCQPTPPQETLQHQQVALVQFPVESLLLSSESLCALVLSVPFKTGASVSPVLWESYNQIPLAFRVRVPGDSQSLCWVPSLRSLIWGSEPSQQWENCCGIIVLQLWVTHPMGVGFDFIVIVPLLLSCCTFLFVFERGLSFSGRFQCLPFDGCSTAGCDFGAVAVGDEHTSFYSAILNRKSHLSVYW